jgi:predicted NBD/HSP70 family sugar kinase
VDNGACTMGQAEMWFGAGRGSADALFLLIGSGVGACVAGGGSQHQGFTTTATEWGHTSAVFGGRACRCGVKGCLEAYISAESVIERFQEASPTATLDPSADEEDALRAILDLAADDRRDAAARAAREVLDQTAVHIGAGIGNLVNLFSPERVIIGGWAGLLLGERLLPRIDAVARGQALRVPFARTSLQLGTLGPDAVALGAATLPVARFLDAGGESRRDVQAGAAAGR